MGKTWAILGLALLALLGCGGHDRIHVVVDNRSSGQVWVDARHYYDSFGGPVDPGQTGSFSTREYNGYGLSVKVFRVSDQYLLFDNDWPPGLVQGTTTITVGP